MSEHCTVLLPWARPPDSQPIIALSTIAGGHRRQDGKAINRSLGEASSVIIVRNQIQEPQNLETQETHCVTHKIATPASTRRSPHGILKQARGQPPCRLRQPQAPSHSSSKQACIPHLSNIQTPFTTLQASSEDLQDSTIPIRGVATVPASTSSTVLGVL